MTNKQQGKNIVVLCGGIGGVKLVQGFYESLHAQDHLYVIVNTGDDFEYLGLSISPDIDTVLYTLANINDKEKGWGVENETWNCMQQLQAMQCETWFQLGDKDIATHLFRTENLRAGETLDQVTKSLTEKLSLHKNVSIIPMSNERLATKITTQENTVLDFQEYFVKERCQPVAKAISYEGKAELSTQLQKLLVETQIDCVVIAPSNPLLSIEPILQVQGMRNAIKKLNSQVPVIAVSPLINGQAVKGPTAKLFAELNLDASAQGVLDYYTELINGFVYDEVDAQQVDVGQGELQLLACNTLMKTIEDKKQLAQQCLNFIDAMQKTHAQQHMRHA